MLNQENDIAKTLIRRVPKEELYGLSVDTSALFSDHKGIYRRRIEKHQRKLLAKLSFLGTLLEPGERILHVIAGCSPASSVEQLLVGLTLHPLKWSLFALTNRRILHVPTTFGLRHRWSVAQILYADCRYIRIRWATMVVKYKSGKTEKFCGIGRGGRKKARWLLRTMPLKGQSSPTMERTHLCPRCGRSLIKDFYECPNCSIKFKSKIWATVLSMVFPGGGYFYTRHPILGVIEAIIETLVFLLAGASASAYYVSYPFTPRPIKQALILSAIILGFEKFVTSLFTNKCAEDFIPRSTYVEAMAESSQGDDTGEGPKRRFSDGWRSM